jgi:hypothetical protein
METNALHRAAQNGNLTEIVSLLEKVDVDELDQV